MADKPIPMSDPTSPWPSDRVARTRDGRTQMEMIWSQDEIAIALGAVVALQAQVTGAESRANLEAVANRLRYARYMTANYDRETARRRAEWDAAHPTATS